MKFDPKGWWQRAREFFREVSSEMKKVTWPSRPEVIGTTGVVLAAVVFFGLYLWMCDVVFYRAIDFIFKQLGARV
ncbi:MAG: preprotein translocase subunit SecE [Thermoanaerobaculia bacterium]